MVCLECGFNNFCGIFQMRTYSWNRYGLGLVFVGLIFAVGCAGQAEQASKKEGILETAGSLPGKVIEGSKEGLEELSETSGYLLESATFNIEDWPRRIIEDTKETFLKPDNMVALLLAGGASIAMHNSDADKELAENFDNPRVFHGFIDETFNVIGSPWTHLGMSSLWYATSAKNQDEFNKQRAGAMLRALGVTSVITMSLKAIRDNDSPNGKNWAWPSGHAASSFTVASVLDEFYGPKVGIPSYALASLVSFRMIDSRDHWGSDVVFGATLGWVVGHTFAGKHKELEVAGFKVQPYMAGNHRPAMGVSLVKKF
jgi:hypothetical protein